MELGFMEFCTLIGLISSMVSSFLAWTYIKAGRKLAQLKVGRSGSHRHPLPGPACPAHRAGCTQPHWIAPAWGRGGRAGPAGINLPSA